MVTRSDRRRWLGTVVGTLLLAAALAAQMPSRAELAHAGRERRGIIDEAGLEPSSNAQLVVLVRHAEKAEAPPDDVALSEAGRARARALADALASAHVDAIVTSQFRRTRETAEPVAAATRVAPTIVPTDPDLGAHARAVADRVRQAGSTVLVVGHSDTIPAIISALGGPDVGPICEAEYANLFLLVLAEGQPPRFVRSTYGQADPPGAGDCQAAIMRRE